MGCAPTTRAQADRRGRCVARRSWVNSCGSGRTLRRAIQEVASSGEPEDGAAHPIDVPPGGPSVRKDETGQRACPPKTSNADPALVIQRAGCAFVHAHTNLRASPTASGSRFDLVAIRTRCGHQTSDATANVKVGATLSPRNCGFVCTR
jgi:hypothetical protein